MASKRLLRLMLVQLRSSVPKAFGTAFRILLSQKQARWSDSAFGGVLDQID